MLDYLIVSLFTGIVGEKLLDKNYDEKYTISTHKDRLTIKYNNNQVKSFDLRGRLI